MACLLPPIIAKLATNFEAWIVGSAASPFTDINCVRDWDVIIPFNLWHKACVLIPKDARPNSFGGWKFTVDGIEIDLWPGDLSAFMTFHKFKYAWHPHTDTRVERMNYE